jgi:ABC-type lipoprotein release transport system permease subunit
MSPSYAPSSLRIHIVWSYFAAFQYQPAGPTPFNRFVFAITSCVVFGASPWIYVTAHFNMEKSEFRTRIQEDSPRWKNRMTAKDTHPDRSAERPASNAKWEQARYPRTERHVLEEQSSDSYLHEDRGTPSTTELFAPQ